MASAKPSTKAILLVALWHNGHRYIELQREANEVFNFFCNLCDHISNTVTGLIIHLQARNHKDNLLIAKNTVLRQVMFPFYDGVLLFGHSKLGKFPPFHPIFDNIGDQVSDFFKDVAPMELQERIDWCFSTILHSFVNDQELIIDAFDFGETGAIFDEGSNSLQIYSKPDIKNLGNLQFFIGYEFDAVDNDFVHALGIEYEFHEIKSIWCEWGNVNPQPDVVDEDDQHDHDDHNWSRSRVKDPAIVVMKASYNNACFLCDHHINAGMDVTAVVNSQMERIACCNWKIFSARNKGKELSGGGININKEFHTYHVSCLVYWLMYNYCLNLSNEAEQIYEYFCPQCGRNAAGEELLSEDQMTIIKTEILEAKDAWNVAPEDSQTSKFGLKFPTVNQWSVTHLKNQVLRRSQRVKYKNMSSKTTAAREIEQIVVYGASKAPEDDPEGEDDPEEKDDPENVDDPEDEDDLVDYM